jgi:rfaE bifunctional protein kinase chain/domain/rfaE bifunctional protein nucleotidyltransferase chain/domain
LNRPRVKIKSIRELAPLVRSAKQANKKIVLAFGCFDVIHIGHVKHLEFAKMAGDLLVVGIIPDAMVHRGPGRPVFDQALRMEQIASLSCVDYVCLSDSESPVSLVNHLRPDIFATGRDEESAAAEWSAAVEATGTRTVFSDFAAFSSSNLINRHLDVLPDSLENYMAGFKHGHSIAEIRMAVESLRDLNVLVVGDLIVDEYCYCRVSGTVSKSPTIAAVFQDSQEMAGGGAAIVRHAAELAGKAHYVAAVGDRNESHRFVSSLLTQENILHRFFVWPETFTVTKRRFITGGYPSPLSPMFWMEHGMASTRLLEIGYMPQSVLPPNVEDAICTHLEETVPEYDVVILADFGHGLVSPRVAKTVWDKARWWSVNAQTNSSNFGFNRITKYRQPDFVCIDELEARLALGDRTQSIETVAAVLQRETECRDIMMTRGRDGILFFNGDRVWQAPALATRVVDTVGAGDAVLSIASLCWAKGIDGEVTGFLSACAGALASMCIGNSEPVRKRRLSAYIEGALK